MELKDLYLQVDKALHSTSSQTIEFNSQLKPILLGKNKKRYITIGLDTFIQADLNKSKFISPKFKDAKTITWIMRPGGRTWGLIVDNRIIKP